jgi:hypothetical protein
VACLGGSAAGRLARELGKLAEPWTLEAQVVQRTRPPLNREHNAITRFYDRVGDARERLRVAIRRPGR